MTPAQRDTYERLRPVAARILEAPSAPETEDALRALEGWDRIAVYIVAGLMAPYYRRQKRDAELRRALTAMLPRAAQPKEMTR
jgi:hypothetical protein